MRPMVQPHLTGESSAAEGPSTTPVLLPPAIDVDDRPSKRTKYDVDDDEVDDHFLANNSQNHLVHVIEESIAVEEVAPSSVTLTKVVDTDTSEIHNTATTATTTTTTIEVDEDDEYDDLY
jgi:hypothetical protein